MAESNSEKYSLGSPLAPIVMCETHELPIDMICEDCDEFICAKCAKTDHREHDWNTIHTAATQRRRSLPVFLKKIKEEDLPRINEKLEKKKKGIVDIVKFMEENNSTMSDYSLIDNHRELTKRLSELKDHTTNCEHSVKFRRGEINDDLVESLVGKTLNLDYIAVIQTNSFEYGNASISLLEAFDAVSTVISTDPLAPIGICQSVDGGLLVTLRDEESGPYKLESHSRRLVRHITVTGDVINEYEFQEDGITRLFKLPIGVTQHNNSDICVVNGTSNTTGELEIMSHSGQMKCVYRGQNLTENFDPTDVVCDSLCNILVTDLRNKQIHLLSPDGEFLKFLLTDEEVNHPYSLSL
ncbi:uncharacterized protein LOC134276785 [Saccostrea cucullata]|uniref:uncharacterized protein LOC134276785 n=1 Tax=Saccostrea cuccullata TaxID=36930 RepID=UPI002ED49CF9